jgi:type IV pilus assembly protein PilC
MPTFQYEALDAQGNTIRASMVADTRDQVLARLRENRLHLVNITTGKDQTGKLSQLNRSMAGVKLREKVIFTRQMATMIKAGLPILRCLDILVQQTKNPFFRETIATVRYDISSGLTFADSLAKHPRTFDDLFVNMIRAAEVGGILDTILDRLAQYLEKEQEIKTKVKSAMMYPMVVLSFALLMTAAIVFFVLPRFKEVFEELLPEGKQLPWVTRTLMDFGGLAKRFFYVPPIIIGGGWFTYYTMMRTDTGRYKIDKAKLKIPVIGDLILKISVSRVCRTLGTLLSSGIPILRALEIVEDTSGNAVVAGAVADARIAVHEGQRMCDPLTRSGIFPVMVTQMIQVGEETGRIDDMLQKVADFYEEEVDALIKGLTSLIEPLMIVGLGLFVGFVAVAVIKPIYGVLQEMGQPV